MAKTILRRLLTPFGRDGSTTNFAKFGSKKAGAPIKTKDIELIQTLAAWVNGLQDAVVAGNRAPYIEDVNSLFLVNSYMLAYLFQEGIPEWHAGQTYFKGSFCRKVGSDEVYQSLQDDNINQVLPNKTDSTYWKWFNEPAIKAGMGMQFMGTSLPQGKWLWQDGSAVSRATYAELFSVIGTVYGVGNGSTTFNLPDMRGRVPMGAGTGTGLTNRALGLKLGNETHTLTPGEMPVHNHGVTDPGHLHSEQGIQIIGGSQGTGPNSSLTIAQQKNTSSEGTGISIQNAGGGGAHNNVQPSLVCNWIIAY